MKIQKSKNKIQGQTHPFKSRAAQNNPVIEAWWEGLTPDEKTLAAQTRKETMKTLNDGGLKLQQISVSFGTSTPWYKAVLWVGPKN